MNQCYKQTVLLFVSAVKDLFVLTGADRDIVKSPLASFFFLLTAMIQGSRANQDALVHSDAIAIIGFLLQKVNRMQFYN